MGDVLGRWFGSESSWIKSLFVTLIILLGIYYLQSVYFIRLLSFVLHDV